MKYEQDEKNAFLNFHQCITHKGIKKSEKYQIAITLRPQTQLLV